MKLNKTTITSLLGAIFFAGTANAAIVGGIDFPDNGFADSVLSTDFTGTFGYRNGSSAFTLEEAVTGSNLDTWMEYGEHDMLPGEDGDYNSTSPPTQYVELGFTDNYVFNGPGNDLVIFEYGTGNAALVALDLQSIQDPYNPTSHAIVVETTYQDGWATNVGYIDLSDLGVALGMTIDSVFVSSALGESGEVYWRMPGFPDWGVPELVAVGALHTEEGSVNFQLDVRIDNGNNDVEENASGTMLMSSADLELVDDQAGGGNQTVGLRFTGMDIPPGAFITNAIISFEADETGTVPTSLSITAEASDDALPFTSTAFDVTNRVSVNTSVAWDNISSWDTVDAIHQTPDIASIVQEVVDQGGWVNGNAMVFIISGSGLRTAEAFEGEPGAAPQLHVEFTVGEPVNRAPSVNAGADQSVTITEPIFLDGIVSDDGLPNDDLRIFWTKVSGPGNVQFSDLYIANPMVSFDSEGSYEFTIFAYDGEFVTSDRVIVVVNGPDNIDPSIPGNLSATALSGTEVSLSWDASTDNVAVAGYVLYRDGVFLADITGTMYHDISVLPLSAYTYTVAAYDGAGNYSLESDPVDTITPNQTNQIDVRINNGNDDVEQNQSGFMLLDSSDLELVDDQHGGGNQTVGLRFTGVDIPQGAVVTSAYIEFETDETNVMFTGWRITAEASGDAVPFSSTDFDVSSRVTVPAFTFWINIAPWDVVDAKHQTPDIATVVQNVVDQGGWVSGNAMVFIINGMGLRTAEAFEGEPGAAPLLHVEYSF